MKYLFVFAIVFSGFLAQAQNRQRIALSYGNGDAQFSNKKGYVGGPSLKDKSLNIFSINYQKEIHQDLFLEIGASYFDLKYAIIPNLPNANSIATSAKLQLLTVPIKLRYELGKYFFVNAGPFVDINMGTTNKTQSQYDYSGIGASIGVGLQYDFSSSFGAFINPQANFHGLIGFQDTPSHLIDAIGTIGVAFHL